MSIFSKIYGLILGTDPATPSSNRRVLYAKSDGWYDKNAAGVVTKLAAGVAGDTVSNYRATLLGADGVLTSTTASENDFSPTTITGAYVSEGVYTLTASTAVFTVGSTIPLFTLGTATGGVVLKAETTSTTVITLRSFLADGTTAADFIGTTYVNVTVDA